MEAFDIQLLERKLRIEPLENGLYRVLEGEHKLGLIYAEADGDQVVWATKIISCPNKNISCALVLYIRER